MNGRRELILATLERLMLDGSSPVSVVRLAKAVGLSRSSLYKYYPDIVIRVRSTPLPTGKGRTLQQALKVRLLQNRIHKQKSLIDSLVIVCGDQLIELTELHVAWSDQVDALHLKVAFLEQQLARSTKTNLKVIK